MSDRLAHGLEDRQHGVEHRLVAAGHDGERAVDGALLAARHRSIQHLDALGFERLADLLAHDRRNRGHIDEEQSRPRALDDAVLPQRHDLDIR